MEKLNIPLYKEIKRYIDGEPIVFHMPGHKMGTGLMNEFKQNMAACDLTEIPGLDNLHYPEEVILTAQKLAASAFGADNSFFLVNGSTSGVLAIIMAVCKSGDSLIVARDCHKSVINGMILAGVNPIYIKPEFDKEFGISACISTSVVEKALISNPEAVGVFLTRPNYYGYCSDIKEIAEITHKAGKILIVDEAHGAHLHFNNKLPVDAISGGADICVQSAHKTLPALTQAAFVHVKGNRINIDKLKLYLSILQTSSPSYIIMASLDIARATMEAHGQELLGEVLGNISNFKKKLKKIEKIKTLSNERNITFKAKKRSIVSKADETRIGIKDTRIVIDETRIVINVRELGITGFYAEKYLRDTYNIQVEMSDLYNIVCIVTIAHKEEDFQRLYLAIEDIALKFKDGKPLADICNTELSVPKQIFSLKDTLNCKSKTLKFKDAVKQVSLNTITPYPPGIPLICPGEEISEEIHLYITKLLKSGGKVNGIGNNEEISIII